MADSVDAALRAVQIQHWSAIAALLSIVVVPVLILTGVRRFDRRSPWQRVAVTGAGCASAALYIPAAFVFAVCWGGEIGESGKDRLARAYGSPVVAALARYHEQHGAYPAALSELVPQYLSRDALRAPEEGPLKYPFEYRRDSAGYELVARYVGPGMNRCRIRPGQRWRCGGYF